MLRLFHTSSNIPDGAFEVVPNVLIRADLDHGRRSVTATNTVVSARRERWDILLIPGRTQNFGVGKAPLGSHLTIETWRHHRKLEHHGLFG